MEQKLSLGSKFRYGLTGVALMVGKLTWDAINDPLFGCILGAASTTILAGVFQGARLNLLGMGDQVSFVLLVMLVNIGIFLVPCKLICDRINKGPAYALGLGIASLAVITAFFLPRGPTALIYVVAVIAGMGFSAQWVCPWSMPPWCRNWPRVRRYR
jgi:Na+/melibiose symporter-like transporter